MSRMTITIEEELVQKAKDILGASTKTEAIRMVLQDFLRRKELDEVLEHQGRISIDLDQESLQQHRKEK